VPAWWLEEQKDLVPAGNQTPVHPVCGRFPILTELSLDRPKRLCERLGCHLRNLKIFSIYVYIDNIIRCSLFCDVTQLRRKLGVSNIKLRW
jgi:hypothetical protein